MKPVQIMGMNLLKLDVFISSKDCYTHSILPAISTPVSKLGRCHTIQHINLAPTPVGRRKFSVLIEKVNNINKLLRSANPSLARDGERKSFIAIEK